MSRYRVTKNYSPELGLSATFRQWRATSHCRFIHGYALGVRVTLECDGSGLDENGWVANFGGLKAFKQYLCDTFDHKMLVAKDDPYRERMLNAFLFDGNPVLAQPVMVERTGCEGFARMVGEWFIDNVLADLGRNRDIRLVSMEVYEHTGNSATWMPDHD